MDKFSCLELEKDLRVIDASIKSIAYLKPRMGFSRGLTFFTNDNGCWEMLSWARDVRIDVYYECIVENANDKMNVGEESVSENAHMEGEK